MLPQPEGPVRPTVPPSGAAGSLRRKRTHDPDALCAEVSQVNGLTSLDVERGGRHAETLDGLSGDGVIAILAGAAGDADVTMVLARPDHRGRLLVGLDRGRVFIGKEELEELFQFVADTSPRDGVVVMNIGGVETEVDARYVTSPAVLEVVAREWLSASADVSGGFWERR